MDKLLFEEVYFWGNTYYEDAVMNRRIKKLMYLLRMLIQQIEEIMMLIEKIGDSEVNFLLEINNRLGGFEEKLYDLLLNETMRNLSSEKSMKNISVGQLLLRKAYLKEFLNVYSDWTDLEKELWCFLYNGTSQDKKLCVKKIKKANKYIDELLVLGGKLYYRLEKISCLKSQYCDNNLMKGPYHIRECRIEDFSANPLLSDYFENYGTESYPKLQMSDYFENYETESKIKQSKVVPIPPPSISSVQFSAIAPDRVSPGKYLPINVVMYEDEFRTIVEQIVRSHGDKVQESMGGYHDVENNSLIKVVLSSMGLDIKDEIEERIWNGKYLNFEFVVKIPADFKEEQIVFWATVYVNEILATKLKLVLDCEGKQEKNIKIFRNDILSAFVSYASQDRNRVACIVQGMEKARPDMNIFFDVVNIHSGEIWETVIKNEIENRDILYLCWSRYAKESEWVEKEWKYALENKGEECIEPIPIESPDITPPPVELQKKHFNDKMLYIIKPTTQRDVTPYLVRLKNSECIEINKPLIRIGRLSENIDVKIDDNPTIGRRHANIISGYGKHYIVDLNSTNHTYIEGEKIPSNVEILIKHGTRIRLSNEEFEFICE